MRYLDLITTLNHLTQKQEAVVQFKALRQILSSGKNFNNSLKILRL